MLTREQLLALADDAEGALKRLRKRLASSTCEPPPAIVSNCVDTLLDVSKKLTKLDTAVRDATEKGKP